jgi:hypothetical protein
LPKANGNCVKTERFMSIAEQATLRRYVFDVMTISSILFYFLTKTVVIKLT